MFGQETATENMVKVRYEIRHAAQMERGRAVTESFGGRVKTYTWSCMKCRCGEKVWAGWPGRKGKQELFNHPLAEAKRPEGSSSDSSNTREESDHS